MRAAAGLLGVALVLGAAAPVVACGDKLLALGGGVPFERIASSRQEGARILVLVEANSALRQFVSDRAPLDRVLSRAGHDVRTVDSLEAATNALRISRADVVLADYTRAADLRQRWSADTGAPLVLAVEPMQPGSSRPAGPNIDDCVVRVARASSPDLLTAISRLLVLRRSGSVPSCAAGTSQSG
jgi:hypothetical protein